MGIENLLEDCNVLAVVCNQWGDTGKGKFVDYFAEHSDIIARGTGGANAGHTINLNGKDYVFHLIPSGILHDGDGKTNILGTGVAFDPRIVGEEMDLLDAEGKSYDNLMISKDAKLVLPQHLVMDRLKEDEAGNTKIGTTGRGIGPVYRDHVDRVGLKAWHLLNKDLLSRYVKKNVSEKQKLLQNSDSELVKQVMHHDHLMNGAFYSPQHIFDVDSIVEAYHEMGRRFKDMIADTDNFLRENLDKKVLLEGAQGLLLDIDQGSYPYVTSSNPSIRGLCDGVGISEKMVDKTFGIVKAFYMTRVGEGPFPTELGGLESAAWCSSHTKEEEKSYSADLNSADDFQKGIAIRLAGGEYGATTERPRRTGWLDLPLLRHAVNINGPDVILTKVDVLSGAEEVNVCSHYVYEGPERDMGNYRLKKGDIIRTADPDSEILSNCTPVYASFRGWSEDISGIRDYNALPQEVRNLVDYVEKDALVNASIISVGPKRDQTIVRE